MDLVEHQHAVHDYQHNNREGITHMAEYSFRHLDPSVIPVYRGTVVYGFESSLVCYMLKVKNGYVVETPSETVDKWIRGQHLETLKPYFQQIKPLRYINGGY